MLWLCSLCFKKNKIILTSLYLYLQIEATDTKYWYGFDVEVGTGDVPTTINMVLYYKTVACDDTTEHNKTTSRVRVVILECTCILTCLYESNVLEAHTLHFAYTDLRS